jgi:glutamate dehydrogenase (NAD(P)+)
LDVPALTEFVDRTGSVVGYPEAQTLPDKDLLLLLEVTLLVPAAVEGVLDAHNAGAVRARIIVEGANGPTTPEADEILQNNDVLVVPDILANAGGVVVSYFEWAQANQAYWWKAHEVEQRLAERMRAGWQRVRQHAKDKNLTLRTAATSLAVKTVTEAHQSRGLYP